VPPRAPYASKPRCKIETLIRVPVGETSHDKPINTAYRGRRGVWDKTGDQRHVLLHAVKKPKRCKDISTTSTLDVVMRALTGSYGRDSGRALFGF
jgi:hypothetical protein